MSLQFFDKEGTAVHKIYAVEDTDIMAMQSLVEAYASQDQQPGFEPEELAPKTPRPLDEIDTDGFVEAWKGIDDRSEEHTSELQSRGHLVCRLLLEQKKQ